jgi:hypothetical protein
VRLNRSGNILSHEGNERAVPSLCETAEALVALTVRHGVNIADASRLKFHRAYEGCDTQNTSVRFVEHVDGQRLGHSHRPVGYTGNSSTMRLDAGKAPASALWVASHACVLFQSASVSDDNNPGICINNASCANFVVAQDFGGNLNCIVRNVGISAIRHDHDESDVLRPS